MNTEKLIKELNFKATRSSGAGGQHVNKVSSKIELFFDVENSLQFSEEEKNLLFKNLATRLTKENILILTCYESRSQHKNKELAIQRFLAITTQGLIIPKKRKPTKPSKASIKKKAENKKKVSVKKALRKKPGLE
ncbi:Peptidyl-tRNA hydrolase ArfB [Polaribacter huanghezhanensis]|uniref:alternative ribosome rescue aminoacyl-tRNA hydrolase ArfB n=1 Tax=Polaribacter huanghezhanensis TaxID=1354726 RepID=UPI00264732D4|nr:alternative ribosome rescue aminoacyl-tRNA hydrolase ArfB [Polaribacter huanghezhanensis]WKD85756.1 Peptidyl-tRNA hydrolase ArfB [Polaribacter huanghezhanensis]